MSLLLPVQSVIIAACFESPKFLLIYLSQCLSETLHFECRGMIISSIDLRCSAKLKLLLGDNDMAHELWCSFRVPEVRMRRLEPADEVKLHSRKIRLI